MNTERTELPPRIFFLQNAPVAIPGYYTLLDLVQAVSTFATSDEEIVATVAFLINSGQVFLCGTFAGAKIEPAAAASAASDSPDQEPQAESHCSASAPFL